LKFEIEGQDTATRARVGRLETLHGTIETPAFIPVGTAATVKGMAQDELEELGVQILLANTYHLFLRPGHPTIAELGGLHRFMSWPHPILTDSGGFQVMSLKGLGRVTEDGVMFRSYLDGSSHLLTPERAVEIQWALGADIIMALDECVQYPASRAALRRAVKLTGRWARRCADCHREACHREPETGKSQLESGKSKLKNGGNRADGPFSSFDFPVSGANSCFPALFGIVQGGTELDLRRESAEEIVEIGFPGYALGGLSVGETKQQTYDVVEYAAALLPAGRPRYLMGVGTPEDLLEGVARGVDLFDCVMPTRHARNGSVFTSQGRLTLKNARYARDPGPLDPACGCAVCRRYSRAYLRHLFLAGEMLAGILATHHNLHFYLDTMRKIRQAVFSGDFAKYCARVRAGS
jgi:queuine tRNA-ribosyltransferase